MIEPIHIAPTETTLSIRYHEDKKQLVFSGESYPEDVHMFFAPVFTWLEQFLETKPKFTVLFQLDYFNTSSSKALLDLLQMLEDYFLSGGPVEVRWCYRKGIEIIQEAGEEFREDFSLPFHLELTP